MAAASVLIGASLIAAAALVARWGVAPAGLTERQMAAAAAVGLAAAATAVLFTRPLRGWLGRTGSAEALAIRLTDEPEAIDPDDTPLAQLASAIAAEFRLGQVDITADGLPAVTVGAADGPQTEVDLWRDGQRIGRLSVRPRDGEVLGRRDVELVGSVARYVALAVEAMVATSRWREAQHAAAEAHAAERRRLRMDLHDGLGPALASVRQQLVVLARTGDDDRVAEAADRVADAIREVRRLVEGLQPSLLEDVGLISALRVMVDDVAATTGIVVDLVIDDAAASLPAPLTVSMYRIAAEALANIARHSAATHAAVRLSIDEQGCSMTVEDDGRGFDTRRGAGMGLRSIRHRAEAHGGQATVTSSPSQGTSVSVQFPMALA